MIRMKNNTIYNTDELMIIPEIVRVFFVTQEVLDGLSEAVKDASAACDELAAVQQPGAKPLYLAGRCLLFSLSCAHSTNLYKAHSLSPWVFLEELRLAELPFVSTHLSSCARLKDAGPPITRLFCAGDEWYD